MYMSLRACFFVLLYGALFLGGWSDIVAETPSVLYLTWMRDPTTTMTVQWHTTERDPLSQVYYRRVGESGWQSQEGIYSRLPKTDFLVHTVELESLEPDNQYQFRIAGKEGIYRFRTLPARLTRPVTFVVGGDAYFYLSTLRKMNAQIAARDPDFVVVGGDIAYTHGRRALFMGKGWEINRWRTFFKEWKSQMVTSDQRMIPIVPVPGNHDVRATALATVPQHLMFYELFAMGEKGVPFRTLDLGDYLSLFLLDTGHSYHIEGAQTDWLKNSLSHRENVTWKMAAYHIAGYPSVYPFHGIVPKKIRTEWAPLFERYHLNVAFEHHNHAYKRTHPMKGGRIDPDGVIYMGDGSWGVTPRKPRKLWYLDAAQKTNAVCVVTLHPEGARIGALSIRGKNIDSVMIFPTRSMVAWNEGRLLQNH